MSKRQQWTVRDLREWLGALEASVGDDEIEGMTLEQLDCLPVIVRVMTEDECRVGALTDANVEGDHGGDENIALILDGEFEAIAALGPSNDEPDEVRVEMLLAAVLSENVRLHEPGDGRDRADDGAIDAAWDIRTVRECPHRLTPPPAIADTEIDRVFAEAPATIREVEQSLRDPRRM